MKKKENNSKIELRVYRDDCCFDPRSGDNLTSMVCFNHSYRLGDENNYKQSDYLCWAEVEKDIRKKEDVAIIKPLYIYDHSGITISTSSFNCPWDSYQTGFVYITKDRLEMFKLAHKTPEELDNFLEAEVKEYDYYLTGEVYGLSIIEISNCECCGMPREICLESIGGFTGENWDELKKKMKAVVDEKYEYLFDEFDPINIDE